MSINAAIVVAEQSTRVRVLGVLELQLMEGSEASGDGVLERIKAARRGLDDTAGANSDSGSIATASALTTAATTSASKVEAPLSKEV